MSTNLVDARGLACPQPVIATKKALEATTDGVITTIVDNQVAKENVIKFAVANGCGVSIEEKGGHFHLKITKGAPTGDKQDTDTGATGPVVYLISKETLGHGSDELGAVLTKAFFVTMLEVNPLPKSVLFINSGIKLAAQDSPVLDHLKALSDRGVELLSCGTCLDYYHLKEKLAVGSVTNMYTILSKLSEAPQAITL